MGVLVLFAVQGIIYTTVYATILVQQRPMLFLAQPVLIAQTIVMFAVMKIHALHAALPIIYTKANASQVAL